jgi:hypothetical protein
MVHLVKFSPVDLDVPVDFKAIAVESSLTFGTHEVEAIAHHVEEGYVIHDWPNSPWGAEIPEQPTREELFAIAQLSAA